MSQVAINHAFILVLGVDANVHVLYRGVLTSPRICQSVLNRHMELQEDRPIPE
jgi:hypothetical protein